MESIRDKVAEHLVCSICLEQYQNPKVFPCLHSYCYECITKLVVTNGDITCPECRTSIQVGNPPNFSLFQSNFVINNIQATLSLKNGTEKKKCENCDSGDAAKGRCRQCSKFLCDFCIKYHERSLDTKAHVIKSLHDLENCRPSDVASVMHCPKHKGEIVKLFCETCQKCICRDCTIVEHRQHSYQFVGDIVQREKGQLRQLVSKLKDRKPQIDEHLKKVNMTGERLVANAEAEVSKIEEYFEDIFKKMRARKDELIKDVKNIESSKMKKISTQKEDVESKLSSCESVIDFTEKAFVNGSDVEILNIKKVVANQLNSLGSINQEVCADDYVHFQCEPLKICDQLLSLYVTEHEEQGYNYSKERLPGYGMARTSGWGRRSHGGKAADPSPCLSRFSGGPDIRR